MKKILLSVYFSHAKAKIRRCVVHIERLDRIKLTRHKKRVARSKRTGRFLKK